jgi:hypothetical protein
MGQAYASAELLLNAKAIRQETMVRQATNCDIHGLEPPAQTPHDVCAG